MNIDDVEFNRSAVRPMECMREGWQLIKDDYWLFLGITFVGVFIGGMGPMGVLLGPMMCGIYLCLLHQERGKKVSFEILFQGFQHFVPSLVATLIELAPIFILVIGWYVLMVAGMFALLAANPPNRQGPPPDGFVAGFFGVYFGGLFLLIVVSVLLKVFFLFTYLLIVEKQVSGWDAVRLSFRAARANFGGILGVLLLSGLLAFVGLLFCGIGVYFELPLSYAMFMIAYRQIFPHQDPFERFDDYDDDDEPDEEPMRRLDDSVDTSVKVDPAL